MAFASIQKRILLKGQNPEREEEGGDDLSPKYIPDYEDIWSTKPCAICGCYVIDDDKETCCSECEFLLEEMFREDYEWFLWKDYETETESEG